MSLIKDIPFLVVDVETNGHDAIHNRITEYAIVVVQNGQILSEYSSLVNPHQFIPPFVANLTGITNEIAYTSPEANDVLKNTLDLYQMENAVFTAHNVKFDWAFVYHTHIREGFPMPADMNQLCTLRLARKFLIKDVKKNVGSLADYFGIKMRTRHRALDDAKATAQILINLLDIAEKRYGIVEFDELFKYQNKRVPENKPNNVTFDRVKEKLNQVPDAPGVYYFLNGRKNIIYVGKAKSLKKRVGSYFTNASLSRKKTMKLLSKIYDIKWKETPSELQALILESKEIKLNKPEFNMMDKFPRHFELLKINYEYDFPILEKVYHTKADLAEYFGPFYDQLLVSEMVKIIEREFKMVKCEPNFKPSPEKRPCILHQMGRCEAPCNMSQTKEQYMLEVEKVRKFLSDYSNGIISDFETQIKEYAKELKFEEAGEAKKRLEELKRALLRPENVAGSLDKKDLIVVMPNSGRDKTVDVYFIKQNLLIHHETIGRKANLSEILSLAQDSYFRTISGLRNYNGEEMDQIRIINSWLYRNKDNGAFIYIEKKDIATIEKEVQQAIKHLDFETTADFEDYEIQ